MAKFWKNLIRIGNPVVNLISSISGLFKKDSLVSRVFRAGDSIVNSVLDAASGDAVGNWIKGVSGSGLTNAEIQQNDWNALQAQEQRAWTEQMDNTKYQRQTADMAAAGLNPAMMYGQGYSASTPSGASASGGDAGSPSAGLLDSVLSVIFAKQRMSNLRAEGDVLRSQADDYEASAELKRSQKNETDINAAYKRAVLDAFPSINEATLAQIWSQVKKYNTSADLDTAEYDLAHAREQLTLSEKVVKDIESDWLPRIKAAETDELKARAAQEFANAAWEKYMMMYAEEHGGTTPGREMMTGFAATMTECVQGAFSEVKNWISSIIPDSWKK